MSRAAEAAELVLRFGYSDRGGPLQSARATTVIAWCAALGLGVALFMNPFVLVAILAAVLVVGWHNRVLGEVAIAVLFSLPLSLAIAVINPIVSQQGVTVIFADHWLPLVGHFDVTREALVYGVLLALRTTTIFALSSIYVVCVSPDQLLRVLRRYSVRSAITASLSVRFVPTLARDGANMSLARACRPGEPPGSATVVRAAFARSLDRAGDSALALETRGFSLARPMRVEPPPRRIVDHLLIVSSLLTCALIIGGRTAGVAAFEAYPLTEIAAAPRDIGFAVLLFAAAVIPLLARRSEAR
jgi:energy-coupling factor transport system permease protein